MSDLLSIGKTGVLAYRDALAGISENVVNASNDGFARRQVGLKEQTAGIAPSPIFLNKASFNGVQATEVNRVWDQFRAMDAWSANADASEAGVKSQYLTDIQSGLGDDDSGVGVKLTAIFTAANALSANPGDTTLRQGVLFAVGDAAGAILDTSNALGAIDTQVFQQASTAIGQLNDSLNELVQVNLALKTAQAGTSARAALEDQRDALIGKISTNVGVDTRFDTHGSVTLSLNDGGAVLVDGSSTQAAQLDVSNSADGRLSYTVTTNIGATPASPQSGALAGYADVSANIADRQAQLDALAANLVSTLNKWQLGGKYDATNQGTELFDPVGTTATTMKVLITDPAKIAASDGTTDNGNLLALGTLRTSSGLETGWRAITSSQALLVNAAQTKATSTASQKDSAYAALDDVSGVDLDSQAADLLRFQQAYSASAKIIQTARETLQAVLDLF